MFSLRRSAVRRLHGHARSQRVTTANSFSVRDERPKITDPGESQALNNAANGLRSADAARRRFYRGYGRRASIAAKRTILGPGLGPSNSAVQGPAGKWSNTTNPHAGAGYGAASGQALGEAANKHANHLALKANQKNSAVSDTGLRSAAENAATNSLASHCDGFQRNDARWVGPRVQPVRESNTNRFCRTFHVRNTVNRVQPKRVRDKSQLRVAAPK